MARIRNRYTYVEEGTEGGETFKEIIPFIAFFFMSFSFVLLLVIRRALD